MIPSDMVAEIQAHDFQDILPARIYPLLTSANRRLCSSGPYPFLEKFSTWTETVPGNGPGQPLALAPLDIRAVRNFGAPAVADNGGNIQYLRKDYVEKFYGFNSYLIQDTPVRHYCAYGKNSVGGCNLYVYPFPTFNYVFALDYYAMPPVLGAGTTEAQMLLPDEYSPLLMDIVIARLSRGEGDLQDGDTFDAVTARSIATLQNAFDVNMDSPDPMLVTQDLFFDW